MTTRVKDSWMTINLRSRSHIYNRIVFFGQRIQRPQSTGAEFASLSTVLFSLNVVAHPQILLYSSVRLRYFHPGFTNSKYGTRSENQ